MKLGDRASPSESTHQNGDGIPSGQDSRQLLALPATTELKKREEDGPCGEKQDESPRHPSRAEIAATLQRLRETEDGLRQRAAAAREAQRDGTRRLVKLMHLETVDQSRIAAHTAQVTLQNEIDAIVDKMRRLEDQYQQAKKSVSTIPDKNERHHQVQLAKAKRDKQVVPLRERLKELDPTARPSSSHIPPRDEPPRLPVLSGATPEKKASSAIYRQTTDRIRELQKTRKSMADPFLANLKMAKLWQRINDHERALENYEKALRSLGEKDKRKIPDDDLPFILESERHRKREALQFLFMRSLQLKERHEAAKMMRKYLQLSTPCERVPTAAHLEELLRKQAYVEDPSLSTPEEVTTSILCSNSLGPLADLRFELLQELLTGSPQDPYLLEAVANVHVRKHGFEDAQGVCDRFVKLPDVKRIQLFAGFAEFTPISSSSATLV